MEEVTRNAEALRRFRQRRRDLGLCRDCGEPSALSRCAACNSKERAAQKRYRRRVQDMSQTKLERAMLLVDLLARRGA